MRPLRIAAYAAAGLIGLIVVALVLVVVFVDPNDYRDDIERMVESKTGRQLTLSGDLHLSVFPWLALKAGPATSATRRASAMSRSFPFRKRASACGCCR